MVMYKGDRLPSAAVAVVSTNNTKIDAIDGVEFGKALFARYELLPGVHLVSFRYDVTDSGVIWIHRLFSLQPVALCFTAFAGGRYVASGRKNPNSTWAPEILDQNTARPVFAWLPAADGSCRQENRDAAPARPHRRETGKI